MSWEYDPVEDVRVAKYLVARNTGGDRRTRGDTWQWGLLGIWIPQGFSTPSPNAWLQSSWEEHRGFVSVNIVWANMLVDVGHVML